jgi:general secretion pathway protein J
MRTLQRRCRHHAAGFTLLESLIATALMAMILAALATITAQWLPGWNRGLARVQRAEQLALGLERLVADLAAAELIPIGREARQPLFDGTDRSVTLVRTAAHPNGGPGLEIVRIAEVGSERGPVLVRARAPFVPVAINDRDQPDFTDPVVLVRAPYRLSFSYAGADRIWQDSWRQATLTPRAVRLTLRDGETRQILAVSTATLVHAELPAECISAKSAAACHQSRLQPPESAERANASPAGQSR